MKFSVLAVLLLNLSVSAQSFAKQDTASLKLVCLELDASESEGQRSDDLTEIAKIEIDYSADGTLQSIQVHRRAKDEFPTVDQIFNSSNSHIEHGLFPTPTYPDGTPTNAYDIKESENFVVTVSGKQVFKLMVNDHAYAGHPGSTIIYTKGSKEISTERLGNVVRCDGRVLRPWNMGASSLEEE